MASFPFDLTEFVSLIVAVIGFAIILYLYFKRTKSMDISKDLIEWKLMFAIFFFILLNRFFTNIEALAYKLFFNYLEHISSALAGIMAVVFSWRKFKRWYK